MIWITFLINIVSSKNFYNFYSIQYKIDIEKKENSSKRQLTNVQRTTYDLF